MQKMETADQKTEQFTQVQQITAVRKHRSAEETQHLAAMLVKTFASMSLSTDGGADDASMEQKVVQILETVEYDPGVRRTHAESYSVSARRPARPFLSGTGSASPHRSYGSAQHEGDELQTPTVRFVARPRHAKCPPACRCKCHAPKSPALRLGGEMLGRLFVGYSGVPGTATTCDVRTCLAKGRLSIEVSYVFPTWFLHYAVSAVFRRANNVAPSLGLFVTKRVGFDPTSILYAAWVLDLDAVKRIVNEDPYAVHYGFFTDGRTALHLALHNVRRNWDWSVVRFLIQHGADPLALDDCGRSATANATRLILEPNTGGGGEEAKQHLADLFNTSVYLDSLDLPHITKVILGVCPGSVRQLLRKGIPSLLEMVNKPDALGYTPLWWAVVADDAESVRALVETGVDVNKGMIAERVSPLSRAMGSTNFEIIETLLAGGADVHACDVYGWQPIHWACRANNMAGVQQLRALGVDLNAVISVGEHTPAIVLAAQHDSLETLRFLTQNGVDVNTEDGDGENALSTSVASNSHRCLEFLMTLDVNPWVVVKSEGSTILHLVAQIGDAETLRLLTRAHGFGLDTAARNKEDLTPAELFEARRSESEELTLAFDDMMESIASFVPLDAGWVDDVKPVEDAWEKEDTENVAVEDEKGLDTLSESEDEDEEFHDALDTLDGAEPPPPYKLDHEIVVEQIERVVELG